MLTGFESEKIRSVILRFSITTPIGIHVLYKKYIRDSSTFLNALTILSITVSAVEPFVAVLHFTVHMYKCMILD